MVLKNEFFILKYLPEVLIFILIHYILYLFLGPSIDSYDMSVMYICNACYQLIGNNTNRSVKLESFVI